MVSGDAGTDPVSGDLTREGLAEALQDAWDEFCNDTGCFPDCITVEKGRGVVLSARFGSGNFAQMVLDRLAVASRDPASRSEERPGLAEEERAKVDAVREQSIGYFIGEEWYRTSPTDCLKLCDLIDRLTSRDRQAEGLSEEEAETLQKLRQWIDYICPFSVAAHAFLDAHFPPPAPTPVLREEEAT